jgi:HD-GYP domain-containing protein (c-di-GMP phosphodiesterase class II)
MSPPSERVPLEQVSHLMAVGEPLPFRVFDALNRLLLNEGQKILSDSQLAALIERGAWVERAAVARVEAARAGVAAPAAAAARALSLFDRWEQAVWQLDRLLKAVAAGQHVAAELTEFTAWVIELAQRDPDVALFAAHRQEDRRFALYPLTHAIHCALLCRLASAQAGWPAEQQALVVSAALTMNVSMLDLQAQMAEQKDPPTRRQLERIRAHPQTSAHLLRAAGVVEPAWLEAVRDHHETPGGSGYPTGRAEVSDQARMLRYADVYMAKITPRALRAALPPRVAVAQLFQQSGGDALAVALVKAVGVNPPGTLVHLASGEVAVVIRRTANGAAPVVSTLSDRHGRPVPASVVRETQDPSFALTPKPVDAAAFGRVLPERVYGWIPG